MPTRIRAMCFSAGKPHCFIDFGMVGRLSPARRDELVDLLAALSRRNERGILEVLLEWTGSEAVDESQLHADIGEFCFSTIRCS